MFNLNKTLKDILKFNKQSVGSRIENRVWTNPSPTSDFGERTISCDLSNATEAKIVAQFYPTSGLDNIEYGNTIELTVPINHSGDIKMFSHTGTNETESVYIWTRRFKTTSSSVYFGDCILRLAANSTYSSTQPLYCVPLYISAVNYLGSGEKTNNTFTVYNDDTGWIEATGTLGNPVGYRRKNGWVYITSSTGTMNITGDTYTTIFTLPEGFRPSKRVQIASDSAGATTRAAVAYINTDGTVNLYENVTSKYFNISAAFPVDSTSISMPSQTNVIADYIVEQGTSGSWYYIKYNSGKCILWGTDTVNTGKYVQSWGNIIQNNVTITLPFYIKNGIATGTANTDTGFGWLSGDTSWSNSTKTVTFETLGSQQGSTVHYRLQITGLYK